LQVRLRLFAIAKDRVGRPLLTISLPERATVGDLKRALATEFPALNDLIPSLMIAVESEYATDDRILQPGAEIAAIPPVSGGVRNPRTVHSR
jgi:molybdopterin converting factor subunit 1